MYTKRVAGIIIKVIGIMLIPYYLIMDSHTSGSLREETTYYISGILGYTSSPGTIYVWPDMPTVFWEQNQILYSLLFISPMIVFSFYFAEHKTNKKSIIAGIGTILISSLSLSLLSPDYTLYGMGLFYLFVPNVVSLSMFVFVFWPLLRNAWQDAHTSNDSSPKERKFSKLRNILGEFFPRNVGSLIWISMVLIPSFLVLYLQSSETYVQQAYQISGGISYIYYDYRFISSGFGSSSLSTFLFATGMWVSLYGQIFWIANLLLGIITLQYIRKETPKKRLSIAVGIVLLLNIIPAVIFSIMINAFTPTPYLQIPLPIFPLVMLLLAKFVQFPVGDTKDMIKVPLRTRISSYLQRDANQEVKEDITESDGKVSDEQF